LGCHGDQLAARVKTYIKICVLYGGTSTKISIYFIELGIETPASSG
jgi:hypothetical protein